MRGRHFSIRVLALVAIAAASALLLTSLAGAKSTIKTVVVTVTDSSLKVSSMTAPAGKVKFVVKNKGKKGHVFSVNRRSTPVIKPGKSAVLLVTFTKGGKYAYRVSLFRGRTGTLAIAAPKPSTGKGKGGGVATAASDIAAGKGIFKANCGSCHTLAAAGTHGTTGPNLGTLKLTLAKIEDQVTNGGRFMPPFGASAGGSLSEAQVKHVAEFVYSAQHGGK